MVGFYRKDGKTRPLTPKKGRTVVTATVIAGILAASGAEIDGVSSTGESADSTITKEINPRTSKNAARHGKQDEAWRRIGLRRIRSTVHRELRCGLHSYGQVQQFFLRTPCRSLRRMLAVVGDAHGNTVVISIAWVRMPTSTTAKQLKRLVDTDGAGNVFPLGSELLGLRGVWFTGQHHASRQSGSLVVITESASAVGRPNPRLLDDVARIAVEFPER